MSLYMQDMFSCCYGRSPPKLFPETYLTRDQITAAPTPKPSQATNHPLQRSQPSIRMAYYCTDCDKLFHAGRKARDQHCQVTGHASSAFECDSCSDCFEDEYDRHQHMNLEQHWHRNAPECQFCGDRAVAQAEIREHEIEQHFHRADCNRQSMNANCLRMVSSCPVVE